MTRCSWRSIILLVVIASACGKALPGLDNIDLVSWKGDRNGCGGKRNGMRDNLASQKEKLLSLSEDDIVALLGKPDQNELYKRNQKFYYYFLEPSPDCQADGDVHPLKLVVRFNAVGLANEVRLER